MVDERGRGVVEEGVVSAEVEGVEASPTKRGGEETEGVGGGEGSMSERGGEAKGTPGGSESDGMVEGGRRRRRSEESIPFVRCSLSAGRRKGWREDRGRLETHQVQMQTLFLFESGRGGRRGEKGREEEKEVVGGETRPLARCPSIQLRSFFLEGF